MRPYDLITFDCYGTLIDWETGIAGTIERVARALELRVPAAKLVGRYVQIEFGLEQGAWRPYREVLTTGLRLLFEERRARLTRRQSASLVSSLPRWKPFPETRRVLEALKRCGYRLAVLSNVDDALLRRSLARIGVRFDHIVTSEQVRSYKPCARHWERVLRLARLPRGRVLHVAASQIHDVIPAKTLGFRCAWINRNGERRGPGARPDHAFPDLSPLTELLTA